MRSFRCNKKKPELLRDGRSSGFFIGVQDLACVLHPVLREFLNWVRKSGKLFRLFGRNGISKALMQLTVIYRQIYG